VKIRQACKVDKAAGREGKALRQEGQSRQAGRKADRQAG
jgi:hypothetical protein